jgi:hypothetical protein
MAITGCNFVRFTIYELRLDDAIGGQSNIQIVVFDPPKDCHPVQAEQRPMRIVVGTGGTAEEEKRLDGERNCAFSYVPTADQKPLLRLDVWSTQNKSLESGRS